MESLSVFLFVCLFCFLMVNKKNISFKSSIYFEALIVETEENIFLRCLDERSFGSCSAWGIGHKWLPWEKIILKRVRGSRK